MPRFYLNIDNGSRTQHDTDGNIFPDDRAAIGHAASLAGSILEEEIVRSEHFRAATDHPVVITVENQDRQPVGRIHIEMEFS